MKPAPANLLATIAALICCAGIPPVVAGESEAPILAQDLEQVRSSGRVISALWTQRSDQYTLQIVFPDPFAAVATRSRPAGGAPPGVAVSTREQIAETQVWLLAKDGSVISPVSSSGKRDLNRGTALKLASLRYLGETPVELQYIFPLSARENAIAVAVMLDGKLYIDRLKPLM